MKNDLILALEMIGAVPLIRYCQITGEQPNAIHQRRYRGVWKVGRELLKPDGSDYWVDLAAVNEWVKKRTGEEITALIERRVQEEARAS